MKISILTATYNRKELIPNLYESILKNITKNIDIEWLIMDDGSTDGSNIYFKKIIKENKINIKYFYQKNQGKMIAINNLLDYITGDLVIEIDSDDYFCNDVFSMILKDYDLIKNDNKIYGLLYLRKILGNYKLYKFPFDNKVIKLYDLYYKHEYKALEAVQIIKADIRKRYKHKLEKDEKFITEDRLYHEIDKNYNGLYLLNKEIINSEYFEDGYTKNINSIFKKYPNGYYKYFNELLEFDMRGVLFKKRLYMIKHLILFQILSNNKLNSTLKEKSLFNKLLIVLLYFPGKIKTKSWVKK